MVRSEIHIKSFLLDSNWKVLRCASLLGGDSHVCLFECLFMQMYIRLIQKYEKKEIIFICADEATQQTMRNERFVLNFEICITQHTICSAVEWTTHIWAFWKIIRCCSCQTAHNENSVKLFGGVSHLNSKLMRSHAANWNAFCYS